MLRKSKMDSPREVEVASTEVFAEKETTKGISCRTTASHPHRNFENRNVIKMEKRISRTSSTRPTINCLFERAALLLPVEPTLLPTRNHYDEDKCSSRQIKETDLNSCRNEPKSSLPPQEEIISSGGKLLRKKQQQRIDDHGGGGGITSNGKYWYLRKKFRSVWFALILFFLILLTACGSTVAPHGIHDTINDQINTRSHTKSWNARVNKEENVSKNVTTPAIFLKHESSLQSLSILISNNSERSSSSVSSKKESHHRYYPPEKNSSIRTTAASALLRGANSKNNSSIHEQKNVNASQQHHHYFLLQPILSLATYDSFYLNTNKSKGLYESFFAPPSLYFEDVFFYQSSVQSPPPQKKKPKLPRWLSPFAWILLGYLLGDAAMKIIDECQIRRRRQQNRRQE